MPVPASARGGSWARPLVSLSALALLSALLGPVHVSAQILFGPQSYTLTGPSPQTFSTGVSTTAGAAHLHVVNGAPDGSARLTHASITLNGVEVASPEDLGLDVALVDKPVFLFANNVLSITLTGPVGGTLTVTLERRSSTLTSLTPAAGRQGETFTVAVLGSDTHFAQGTTLLFAGRGVSVGGAPPGEFGPVAVQDGTHLTATLTLGSSIVLGPRLLLAKTNGEHAALFPGLTVLAGTPPIPGTTVTTLAGTGTPGLVNGPGPTAQFRFPADVAPRADGSAVVADTVNSRLRALAPDGTTTTVSLPVSLLLPAGVTLDATGRTIIADTARCVIRIVNLDGTVTTIGSPFSCTFADGSSTTARFRFPRDVVADATGTLYVADAGNHRVRKIDPQGNVTTLAGSGAFGGTDGPGSSATFGLLTGIAVAEQPTGPPAVLVSDAVFHRLRQLAPDGTVTTVAGTGTPGFADGPAASAQFAFPTRLTRDPAGHLYLADTLNNLIRRLTPQGTLETVAGTGAWGSQDGPGASATFTLPVGVGLAAAAPSTVFVADTFNHKLRVIQVGAPPTITALDPTSGVHGTTVSPFTATGTNLLGATALTFLQNGAPDPAITVSDLVVNADGTALTASVAIATTAALGPRTVTVTTPGGTSDATPSPATTFTVLGQITLIPDFQTLRVGTTGSLTISLSAPAPTGGLTVTLTSANTAIATVTSPVTVPGGQSTGIATITAVAEGTASVTASAPGFADGLAAVTVSALPPDPVTVAPPLDRAAATSLGTATEFLYTGSNPIQTGVAPGAIEARRAAVLRGRVLSRDGSPLSGVTISILNHPEYGTTMSRTDGMFDLAVNGGGQLTVRYEKAGYLMAQRPVTPAWQDYGLLPDVILILLDTRVTTVDLTAPTPIQVARGNPVTDSDGTRQATLFFPQGTTATMELPDGTTQPLTTLSVRATEYTVGPTGPQAMPAPLPPTSGYTYAVELSADEALSAGAKTVRFSEPVIHYVENFLNFPAGVIVPVGYYDREQAAWIPSDNGRVIKILSVTGGLTDLDVGGSGTPADATALAALGITDAERQQLAALYSPGQSLWRSPIPHFSPWDCNWGIIPPPGATSPGQPKPDSKQDLSDCTEECGSILQLQNQALGEAVDIVGTPFRLRYQSNRVSGRKRTLQIPVSGATVPASLLRIDLEVMLAGQRFTQVLPAQPNQTYAPPWDGRDAYGRILQGTQPATIRIGYVYQGFYSPGPISGRAFGVPGDVLNLIRPARVQVTLWQEQLVAIDAGWDARGLGLGGWTLDVHHAYDPGGQALLLGDGDRRSVTDVGRVIRTLSPDNVAYGVAVDGQGSVYFSVYDPFAFGGSRSQVMKVGPDGTVSVVAGSTQCCDVGDGGPATSANLFWPWGLALDKQGNLFIGERFGDRIRKVTPDGIITTVAGTGTAGFSGDGGPATQAQIYHPGGVAVDAQGYLVFADSFNDRVRKISPDGIITTVAGTGTGGFSGDDGPATQARLSNPLGVAVDAEGNLFVGDGFNDRVRKISPAGIITTVAGTGTAGFSGDGGPATQARLRSPGALAVDAQGYVFIADLANGRIRTVGPGGIITTVAGGGTSTADGVPAISANIRNAYGVAVDAQGNLYIASNYSTGFGNTGSVQQVASALPGFSSHDLAIPSADGSELYEFTGSGRHLRTIHTLTGATRLSFSHDGARRLSAVTDGDGNVTQINRDGAGNPTAIVAPLGQLTALSLDGDGYLASISDPAGNVTQGTYSSDGLLQTFTDPRGNVSRFTYDTAGRLTRAEDAAGGDKALGSTATFSSSTTTLTTGLNRVSTYLVETLSSGSTHRVDTAPDGTRTDLLIGADASRSTTAPDGTVTTLRQEPDPRFGMQAPVAGSLTIRAPSGLTSSLLTTRTSTLSDPNNLLSLTSQTDTVTLNGRTYTRSYDGTLRQLTDTSPAGRQTVSLLDPQGRVLQRQVAGLEPISFMYDPRGRLSTVSHGADASARTSTLTYNSQGFLSTLTDPLNRQVGFTYDLAGRVTTQTLPDGRVIRYAYDANGNVTSITPPSRPAHAFTYTPLDLEGSYDPPDVGVSPDTTTYAYNLDRQLTTITRPDGTVVTLDYDGGGRLGTLTIPRGPLTYAYHPTTGQLSTITAPDGGTLTHAYDGALLTSTTWTGTVAGTVSRTYDSDFRLASESVNGTDPIAFAYDPDALLTAAGALTLTRDPQHGLLTGSSLGTVTDSHSYSGFGELSNYSATVSGSSLYTVAYTRDALGQFTEKTETIQGITITTGYTYDPGGRLTDVTVDGSPVAHYEYDGNGNRLGVTRPSGTISGTYDAQDRLLTYGAFTYTYTASGDLQTATEGGNTTTYTYDPLGNLVSVTLPNGTQIEYVIDGQHRRIGKKVNGVLTRGFLYRNQLAPAAELDGAGNVVARFVYGSHPHVPDYLIKGGTTYRILTDHLGSPRLIVDASTGTIAQRMDYDEFGQITLDTSPGFQPFGFAGGLSDPDTQFLRFGARDYDPFTGRWTTKDPIRFAGGDSNLYGYVDGVGKPYFETNSHAYRNAIANRNLKTKLSRFTLGTALIPVETNLYLYTGDNPVNFTDPLGLYRQRILLTFTFLLRGVFILGQENDDGTWAWGLAALDEKGNLIVLPYWGKFEEEKPCSS